MINKVSLNLNLQQVMLQKLTWKLAVQNSKLICQGKQYDTCLDPCISFLMALKLVIFWREMAPLKGMKSNGPWSLCIKTAHWLWSSIKIFIKNLKHWKIKIRSSLMTFSPLSWKYSEAKHWVMIHFSSRNIFTATKCL